MTPEEHRGILVREGAAIIRSTLTIEDLNVALAAEERTFIVAVKRLMAVPGPKPSQEEQLQCFRESCALLGYTVDHPRITPIFEDMQTSPDEQRLLDQLESAPLN